jgi:aminoglycoside phosphotransferase (APT) family kinase protein
VIIGDTETGGQAAAGTGAEVAGTASGSPDAASGSPGAPVGIDIAPTTAWLASNVGLVAPLGFDLVAGGRSNLTYKVTDATGASVVLRRPPTGHVLPTAHDMSREHRIVTALGPTPVPVAKTLGLCLDADVTGAPFYVMEFVNGLVLRDAPTAERELDDAGRRRASESIAQVLADLHAVDVDAVGLGDLGRHEGYLARQLKRWHGQFDQSQPEGAARVVEVDHVYERLSEAMPSQDGVAIVHGDYRLDNTMLAGDGSVAAVLDWEICTLGDPLADLGLLMVYWAEPGDTMTALGLAPTVVPGFASRSELKGWYAERTGRDVSKLDYYVAFGYWKLACILQGVLFRYLGGAGGGDRSGTDSFGAQVRVLAEAAAAVAAGLPA